MLTYPEHVDTVYWAREQLTDADNWIRGAEWSARHAATRRGIDWSRVYLTTTVEADTVLWTWMAR